MRFGVYNEQTVAVCHLYKTLGRAGTSRRHERPLGVNHEAANAKGRD